MDCICPVFDRYRRSPVTYRRGAHHAIACPNYEPPPKPVVSGSVRMCDNTPGEGSCWNCDSSQNCDRI
jgi:hypothetical protein